MDSQVCVICHNKKPVNLTNNRLVTESCGHVKCMDCLLREKSGCIVCRRESQTEEFEDSSEPDIGLTVDNGTEYEESPALLAELMNKNGQDLECEDLSVKEKPETSHIKVEKDEDDTKYYVCTLCRKRFHARSHVAYHAYCNGQRKPYQCPKCNKTFATSSHFKYHMAVEYNERTYKCEQCGECFVQMSKLKRHKLKHTNEKKYKCSECSKSFDNKTALRKHSLTHNGERPFVCAVCGAKLRDPSNYHKHMLKHEYNNCSCDICGSKVVSKKALLAHCKTLHERRPYQCPHCTQSFFSNKDMRRHAQVHSDAKPFRCKICGRRFRRKDNFNRHIRNTHPDSPNSVECDGNAVSDTATNGHGQSQAIEKADKAYESKEKTKLEILNPLPPLAQEVIQKHMHTENTNEITKPVIDTSYILAANNARESVICKSSAVERKVPSPIPEYVHKIRKANSMVSQKDMSLPPIDVKKLTDLLEEKEPLDVRPSTHPKNLQIYKNILGFGDLEKESNVKEEVKMENNVAREMHWRKKKLNIN